MYTVTYDYINSPYVDGFTVNLDNFFTSTQQEYFDNAEEMSQALYAFIVSSVLRTSLLRGDDTTLDDIFLDKFRNTDAGWELDIPANSKATLEERCLEAAQLWWFLDEDSAYEDVTVAYIENSGWEWVDFDDVEDFHENLFMEYDDYADVGKYAVDEGFVESVPDSVYSHIDWDSYGREIAEGYSDTAFNGKSYLFHV